MGDAPPLVAVYTAAGGTSPASAGQPFTQCVAYSNDRGRTWVKYANNPVVGHIAGENRDPKVFWHEPTQRWVMALYLEHDRFAILTSPDLKEWRQTSEVRVPGSIECPDLFELPVEGESGATKWIFWTANNAYLVGDFDGAHFVDQSGSVRSEFGANCFAAQSFSDIPAEDGRRIQIAWMRGGHYPGMPFNQQMSLPTAVTLHRTPEGLRLFRLPVVELERLRAEPRAWSGTLEEGEDPFGGFAGDAYEIEATIDPATAREIVFAIRGTRLAYDFVRRQLALGESRAEAPLVDGKLELRIFVDRTSIEVFASAGRVSLTQCYLPAGEDFGLSLSGEGAIVESLEWWTLRSIWPRSAD
jgi:sucrose-6-phosphate hydrolase SacC (GH32 family)